MSEFKYQIPYIPGLKNIVPVALSRDPVYNILFIEFERRSEIDFVEEEDFREIYPNPTESFTLKEGNLSKDK